MSATEVIAELNKLPPEEQKQVLVFLARKLAPNGVVDPKRHLGQQMGFEEACDVIFRENSELLSLLAK